MLDEQRQPVAPLVRVGTDNGNGGAEKHDGDV
jgi:hypothetical protein